jgi:hypothetical protein
MTGKFVKRSRSLFTSWSRRARWAPAHISGQMLERVGALERRGQSVPARVIAKDAKILGQERELMIPAAVVRGEAVRWDDRGAVLLAVDIVAISTPLTDTVWASPSRISPRPIPDLPKAICRQRAEEFHHGSDGEGSRVRLSRKATV